MKEIRVKGDGSKNLWQRELRGRKKKVDVQDLKDIINGEWRDRDHNGVPKQTLASIKA